MVSLKELSSSVLLIYVFFNLSTDACLTADGREGYCIPLIDCNKLYRVFQKPPLTRSVISFLKNSACGFIDGIPHVCCHDEIDINAKIRNKSSQPKSEPGILPEGTESANELPTYPNCGSAPIKNLSGAITEIDEYPWTALLGYGQFSAGSFFKCGGVLINKRYVLTAARCIPLLGDRLLTVRLGEYDTNAEHDCDEDDVCAPPYQIIEVEEVNPNPDYTKVDLYMNRLFQKKFYKDGDIALLRLARDVSFSRFVKPICLPTAPPNLEVGDVAVMAGWGVNLLEKEINVKLKFELSIFNKTMCEAKYNPFKTYLTDKQFCAGGKYAHKFCHLGRSESLMKRNGSSWEAIGVLSFGNICGEDSWVGRSAVFTDVYSYLPWIKQNLRS